MRTSVFRLLVTKVLLVSFSLALTFAVAPQLHERIHQDAALPQHECAVTLVASGGYHQSDAPLLVSAPQPAIQFSIIPALNRVWIAAPFLAGALLEHAPPALS